MKFKKISKKSQLESHLIPRTFQLRPAYFPENIQHLCFLAITIPSIRRKYFNPEHLLADGAMVEIMTPTYGISCVLGYRKNKVISDWLFVGVGYVTEV